MYRKSQKIMVYEMPQEELAARLTATLNEVLKSDADKNLPFVYRNSLCVRKNQFIHQYADGKRFLVQQDVTNSEETILRRL